MLNMNRSIRQQNKRKRVELKESLLSWEVPPSSPELKFMPVIHAWSSMKKRLLISVLLAFATTCKSLFKMVQPLIIDRGWILASLALVATLYKCKNITLQKSESDSIQHLTQLLEIPGYHINRIHIICQVPDSKSISPEFTTKLHAELATICQLIENHFLPSPSPKDSYNSIVLIPTETLPSGLFYSTIDKFPPSTIDPLSNTLHHTTTSSPNHTSTIENSLAQETYQPFFKFSIKFLRCISFSNNQPINIPRNTTHASIIAPYGTLYTNLPNNLHSLKIIGTAQVLFTSLPNNLYKYKRNNLTNEVHPPLPHSLKKVMFGSFNSPVINSNNLPLLQHFSVRGPFNCPLDDLPITLLYLRIRGDFSHSLGNLPQQLRTLKLNLSNEYKHSLEDLPLSLQVLKINSTKISNLLANVCSFPPHLQHLTLVFRSEEIITTGLPASLATITLRGTIGRLKSLPPSFEVLDMSCMESKISTPTTDMQMDEMLNLLPPTLLSLSYPPFFNSLLSVLPPNLTYIQFGALFNQSLASLPTTITNIVFTANSPRVLQFDQPLYLKHLTQLQEFTFAGSSVFNQPITVESFPQSLLRLQFMKFPTLNFKTKRVPPILNYFTTKFNQPLDSLPQSIQTLTLGPSFSRQITCLPASLITLVVAKSYTTTLPQPSTYTLYTYAFKPPIVEKIRLKIRLQRTKV